MTPQQQVLYYLSGTKERLSSYDLAALTGHHDSYVRKQIISLRAAGLVGPDGQPTRRGIKTLSKMLGVG